MPGFGDFLSTVKTDVAKLIEKNLSDYADAATSDCDDFLDSIKADLLRWTELLAQNQLTLQDFEFLVKGKKDLAELEALRQQGLAQIRMNKFKNGLISTVIGAARKAIM